jgi:hypothetical protein
MGRNSMQTTAATLLFSVTSAVRAASESDPSEAVGGFAIMLGFVALAFVVVWLIRLATRSENLAPDERSAEEFVRQTTPIDRPSIER